MGQGVFYYIHVVYKQNTKVGWCRDHCCPTGLASLHPSGQFSIDPYLISFMYQQCDLYAKPWPLEGGGIQWHGVYNNMIFYILQQNRSNRPTPPWGVEETLSVSVKQTFYISGKIRHTINFWCITIKQIQLMSLYLHNYNIYIHKQL